MTEANEKVSGTSAARAVLVCATFNNSVSAKSERLDVNQGHCTCGPATAADGKDGKFAISRRLPTGAFSDRRCVPLALRTAVWVVMFQIIFKKRVSNQCTALFIVNERASYR